MRKHVVVYISGHGYGHAAQMLPVLNRLTDRHPGIRITIYSTLPRPFLESGLQCRFEHLPEAADFGMEMFDAIKVDAERSYHRYHAMHRDWETAVRRESRVLQSLQPDLVISDIAYRVIAAAARNHVPSVAMCSLNWADIFQHYCGAQPNADRMVQQIRNAYNAADVFLQLEPTMPMAWLENKRTLGPVATLGADRAGEIRRHFKCDDNVKLILLSLGGIHTRLPVERWPQSDACRWIVPDSWDCRHPAIATPGQLNMPFVDVLRSCDALVTKPGYGSFTEAGCNGVPIVYTPRGDWPEEPVQVEWLTRHGRCQAVERSALESGAFLEHIQNLISQPAPPAPQPSGIAQAAAAIGEFLG